MTTANGKTLPFRQAGAPQPITPERVAQMVAEDRAARWQIIKRALVREVQDQRRDLNHELRHGVGAVRPRGRR